MTEFLANLQKNKRSHKINLKYYHCNNGPDGISHTFLILLYYMIIWLKFYQQFVHRLLWYEVYGSRDLAGHSSLIFTSDNLPPTHKQNNLLAWRNYFLYTCYMRRIHDACSVIKTGRYKHHLRSVIYKLDKRIQLNNSHL